MMLRVSLLAALAFSTVGGVAAAEPGLYLGGAVGAYSLELDDTSFDDAATVAKAIAGFRFSDNLALEADYQKLFEIEDDILGISAELDADAWTLALRPIIPLTDFIDLYGKVGYTWYDVEAKTSLLGAPISVEDSDSDFSWGGGIDVNLGNLTLRGELTRIEIEDADLNLVTAGLVFRF